MWPFSTKQSSDAETAKLELKIGNLQKNIAPWGRRYFLAILTLLSTAAFILFGTLGVLKIAPASWIDLAYLALLLLVWCSTVWACFWYTRTLR